MVDFLEEAFKPELSPVFDILCGIFEFFGDQPFCPEARQFTYCLSWTLKLIPLSQSGADALDETSVLLSLAASVGFHRNFDIVEVLQEGFLNHAFHPCHEWRHEFG